MRPDDLPVPWGPKGIEEYKRDKHIASIADNPLPPNYGPDSKPGVNRTKRDGPGWDAADVPKVPNILDITPEAPAETAQ